MDGIQQQRVMRAERYQLEDLTRDPELQPREAIDRDLLPSMSDDTERVATAELKLVKCHSVRKVEMIPGQLSS